MATPAGKIRAPKHERRLVYRDSPLVVASALGKTTMPRRVTPSPRLQAEKGKQRKAHSLIQKRQLFVPNERDDSTLSKFAAAQIVERTPVRANSAPTSPAQRRLFPSKKVDKNGGMKASSEASRLAVTPDSKSRQNDTANRTASNYSSLEQANRNIQRKRASPIMAPPAPLFGIPSWESVGVLNKERRTGAQKTGVGVTRQGHINVPVSKQATNKPAISSALLSVLAPPIGKEMTARKMIPKTHADVLRQSEARQLPPRRLLPRQCKSNIQSFAEDSDDNEFLDTLGDVGKSFAVPGSISAKRAESSASPMADSCPTDTNTSRREDDDDTERSTQPTPAVRRKRGRPPKNKVVPVKGKRSRPPKNKKKDIQAAKSVSVKRKLGRPPKNQAAEHVSVTPERNMGDGSTKRKRGRPRKDPSAIQDQDKGGDTPKRDQGHPPKLSHRAKRERPPLISSRGRPIGRTPRRLAEEDSSSSSSETSSSVEGQSRRVRRRTNKFHVPAEIQSTSTSGEDHSQPMVQVRTSSSHSVSREKKKKSTRKAHKVRFAPTTTTFSLEIRVKTSGGKPQRRKGTGASAPTLSQATVQTIANEITQAYLAQEATADTDSDSDESQVEEDTSEASFIQEKLGTNTSQDRRGIERPLKEAPVSTGLDTPIDDGHDTRSIASEITMDIELVRGAVQKNRVERLSTEADEDSCFPILDDDESNNEDIKVHGKKNEYYTESQNSKRLESRGTSAVQRIKTKSDLPQPDGLTAQTAKRSVEEAGVTKTVARQPRRHRFFSAIDSLAGCSPATFHVASGAPKKAVASRYEANQNNALLSINSKDIPANGGARAHIQEHHDVQEGRNTRLLKSSMQNSSKQPRVTDKHSNHLRRRRFFSSMDSLAGCSLASFHSTSGKRTAQESPQVCPAAQIPGEVSVNSSKSGMTREKQGDDRFIEASKASSNQVNNVGTAIGACGKCPGCRLTFDCLTCDKCIENIHEGRRLGQGTGCLRRICRVHRRRPMDTLARLASIDTSTGAPSSAVVPAKPRPSTPPQDDGADNRSYFSDMASIFSSVSTMRKSRAARIWSRKRAKDRAAKLAKAAAEERAAHEAASIALMAVPAKKKGRGKKTKSPLHDLELPMPTDGSVASVMESRRALRALMQYDEADQDWL